MMVNVWDWRTGVAVGGNKVSSNVRSVSFAGNGSYFVTAGNRSVDIEFVTLLPFDHNQAYQVLVFEPPNQVKRQRHCLASAG